MTPRTLYRRWLEWINHRYAPRWMRMMGFVCLSATITLVITLSFSSLPTLAVVGQVAPFDIRADRNYTIVDRDAVARFKQDAADHVLVIYDFDLGTAGLVAARVQSAFEVARKKYQNRAPDEEIREAWEQACGLGLSDVEWQALRKTGFSKSLEDSIISALYGIMRRPIVNDKSGLMAEKDRGISVQLFNEGEERKMLTWNTKEITAVLSLEDAKKLVRNFKDLARQEGLASVLSQLIQTNFVRNVVATNLARQSSAESVKDVTLHIQSGEIIVKAGTHYEPRHITIIEGMESQQKRSAFWVKFCGYFFLVLSLMGLLSYYAQKFRKYRLQPRDSLFISFMVIMSFVGARIALFLASTIANVPYLEIPEGAYAYAVPVAAATMLVRLVLNAEMAMSFLVMMGAMLGFLVLNDPYYTFYCLVSNLAAASAIAHVDKRSSIMKSGLMVAGVNILVVLGIFLADSNPAYTATPTTVMWFVLAGFLGGIANAFLVLIGTPVVEFLFGYTTDMKLLELANLNHPLLRELIIRAPGTYHHSHLVGILSEAAAEKIGANPLLARVGAYYHDIGKMRKPQYFIENAKEASNWHERISPHMAALIVASHIKDGIEMARQYGIPEQIVDLIPQHHGTKMIGFFYELAKKSNDPEMETLSESDFRYPGPKPQTQEAGILLLADGVEAATRSLKEKSPARIQQMVDNIINKSFVESQLDECDMTLKDLTDIANAFTHILVGIYHQRIEYPKQSNELGDKDRPLTH